MARFNYIAEIETVLARVVAPTLLICVGGGGAYRLLPLALWHRLWDKMARVNPGFVVLEDRGHHAPLESPDEVAAAMASFLAPRAPFNWPALGPWAIGVGRFRHLCLRSGIGRHPAQ